MPAENLDDAFNALHEDLLEPARFDRYFIFTKDGVATELAQRFVMDREPSKNILTGIKGCGKSTELIRLLRELGNDYLGVYISMKEDADLRDVTALDVVLSELIHLIETATAKNVTIKDHAVKDLALWLNGVLGPTRVDFEDKRLDQKGFTEALGRARRALRNRKVRQAVRDALEERGTALIDKLNKAIAEVEAASGKKVLMAVDDLDKLSLEHAGGVFSEQAEILAGPECKITYTMPYSLMHTHDFKEVQKAFSKAVNQGPVDLKGDPAQANAELQDMIAKRMSLGLIAKDALGEVIKTSGGVVADLMRCLAESCVRAKTDGSDTITKKIVARVMDDIRKDESRTLRAQDLAKLAHLYKSKASEFDETFLRLLDEGYILEYASKEGEYHVHPLVVPVLTDRKAL